jgi:hypothetical protein
MLACLWSFTAVAQYIDVQAGLSFASGSFGNNDLAKAGDGFAKNGTTFGIQAGYLVYKKIGICAKAGYSTFGVDDASYSGQLAQTAPPGIVTTARSNGKYKSSWAMAGPSLSVGKNGLTFDFRLMGGFISLVKEGFSYHTDYTGTGQQYSYASQQESDASVAFGWGITSRYQLPKDFYVTLNLDNMYSTLSFNRDNYVSSADNKTSRAYEAYLFTLGIGYRIE